MHGQDCETLMAVILGASAGDAPTVILTIRKASRRLSSSDPRRDGRYLAQMASDTAKLIFDAVSQWHAASNQRRSNPCS
jgi:hypothetical protein